MISHENFRIPGHCNEESSRSTLQGYKEDVCDLQADQEGECHYDRGVALLTVVRRIGELEIEIRKERAEVGDRGGPHC